ncbi:HPr(Ser) kinase/phosphatase [Mycoplasma capricolum subsp. capricolum]|uniref:HPr(Ser) kinase/phosphatase n=1 Tax=Mycoplasma capricolum TaxID=2095 RepID=UPI00062A2932|nr:HPr(Ser) kinase/phosphatase [Mycoplasma capricolum]KKW61248.1 HPr kinase/phosphorylase [Mycoplasma capricolum subsp. capricolum]
MEKFTIKDLTDNLKFEILSGQDKLDTEIKSYGINRAGLELADYFKPFKDQSEWRATLMSTKESGYMLQFDEKTKIKKYTQLMKCGIPVLIITNKFKDETLIKVAKKLDFPLLRSDYPITIQLVQKIQDIYDIYFSPTAEEHAALMNIFGTGVLIKGKSGIGKSELCLDLIKHNHLFIGDDRIILTNKSNKIIGRVHPILKNLIEIRGIGIFDIVKSNGYQVIMNESPVELVVELVEYKEQNIDNSDRLGNDWSKFKILGVEIEHIQIPVSAGRSLVNIIESAVAQFKINKSKQFENVFDVIHKRTKEFLSSKK